MSSPDKLRALLLREDELARTGMLPEPPPASEFKPKLDKTLRLRAIRRLGAQHQPQATTTPKRKTRKKAT